MNHSALATVVSTPLTSPRLAPRANHASGRNTLPGRSDLFENSIFSLLGSLLSPTVLNISSWTDTTACAPAASTSNIVRPRATTRSHSLIGKHESVDSHGGRTQQHSKLQVTSVLMSDLPASVLMSDLPASVLLPFLLLMVFVPALMNVNVRD